MPSIVIPVRKIELKIWIEIGAPRLEPLGLISSCQNIRGDKLIHADNAETILLFVEASEYLI